MHDHDIHLRLRWRHTWADREDDYAAEAPGYPGSVARIYRALIGGQSVEAHWFWSMTAHEGEVSRGGTTSGYEPTARRAAKAAEESWFEAIRGTSLEHCVPEAAINAYAAAKGRA